MEKSREILKQITISHVVFGDEDSNEEFPSYVVTVRVPANKDTEFPSLVEQACSTLEEAEVYASEIIKRQFKTFDEYTLMGGY